MRQEGFESVTRRFESLCWPSAFTFVNGFESITRRFKLPCLVLHNSSFRDSNPCFSLSSCSLWGIRITKWVIRIGGSQHLFFLHMGFESINLNFLTEIWIQISSWGIRIAFISLNSLECGFESLWEGFKSPSSVCTFWSVDSNRPGRHSNHLIWICLKSSRIEEFVEGFESPY